MSHSKTMFLVVALAAFLTLRPESVAISDAASSTNEGISEISGKASPEALRRRKTFIEKELQVLRTELEQRKRDLEEVRLLELEVSSSLGGARIDGDPDVTSGIDRNSADAIFGGELRARARADISEARRGARFEFDTSSMTSFVAKKLALDVRRRLGARELNVPEECNPKRPSEDPSETELEGIVDSCITALKAVLKKPDSSNLVSQEFTRVKTELSSQIERIRGEISDKETLLLEIDSLIGSSEDLTFQIVTWTIPSVGLLLVLFMLAPKIYGNRIQQEIFSTKLVLELLTVYILVSSILILGLANRIENEVLGTLLGGISGYVLGRSLGARRSSSNDDDEPTVDGNGKVYQKRE